ncbi:MAG: sigma factor-like helix-turn-helix DNA-binding protein, partial [Actinomycetota bacterium]
IRALPRFRGDSAVQTWLLAITRRVVAGLLHEQGRQPVVPEPRTPTFSTGLVEIQMALSALPQVLREVLVLTQVVGLSYQEASSVLGIKIGTVRSRVFRAREAMMVALCDRAEEGCVDDGL